MKQPLVLFLLLTLLPSCSLPLATQPQPTAVPQPPTLEPTLPAGQPTGSLPAATAQTVALATGLPTPNLPTATPVASAVPVAGRYENPELGVAFEYPPSWELTPGDGQSSLMRLNHPSAPLVVVMFTGSIPVGGDPEQAARGVRREITASLSEVREQELTSITLADGRTAWSGEYLASDGSDEVQVLIVSAARGALMLSALVYGLPESFSAERPRIDQIVGSIRLSAPRIKGLPRDEVLVLSGGESTNPRDYDPAASSGDQLIFSGLVSFTPQLKLVPDLAEGWQVSADRQVYTFTLRQNARFHDGRPVTAQDVVFSWERALDPATDSPIALTYLGDIVGATERRSGAATSIRGLRVLDERRLEVTINGALPYFLMKLSASPAMILDRANVESGPEWYRTPNGTGPYRLIRWEPLQMQLYERNDDFYLDPPAIRYIVNQLYAGYGLRLYETGQVDIAGVGRFDVARLQDPSDPLHAQLLESVDMCTSFVTFDVTRPPFDDPQVRQAFALAVDRQRYIDVVLQGTALPAQGLYPPALPGYNLDLKGQRFDPQEARRLLAESKYGSADKLPPITFTDSGFGSDVSGRLAALIAMWQSTLGVTITVENLEPNTASDQIHSGNHGQLFWYGWCADYPDPENFADALFHSGAAQNVGKFASPELDRLLEQAREEPEVARRIGLYQQAEQIIVDEAAAIFLNHNLSYLLVKPYVQGYTAAPIAVPIERYLTLDRAQLAE